MEAWIISPHRVALTWAGLNVSSCLLERRLGATGNWETERTVTAFGGEALATISSASEIASYRLRSLSQTGKIIATTPQAGIHPLPAALVAVPMASCAAAFNSHGQFGYVGLDGVLAQAWDGGKWQNLPGTASAVKTVNAINEAGDLAGSVARQAVIWQWDASPQTYSLVPVPGLTGYEESFPLRYWPDGSLLGEAVHITLIPVYQTVNHIHGFHWSYLLNNWVDHGEFAADASYDDMRAALGFINYRTYSFDVLLSSFPYQNIDTGIRYRGLPSDAAAIWWSENNFTYLNPAEFDVFTITVATTQNFPEVIQTGTEQVRHISYFLWAPGSSVATISSTEPYQPPSSVGVLNDRGDRLTYSGTNQPQIQTVEGDTIALPNLPGPNRRLSALSHHQEAGGGRIGENYDLLPFTRFADDTNLLLPIPAATGQHDGTVLSINRYGYAAGGLGLGEGGLPPGSYPALWSPDGTYIDLSSRVVFAGSASYLGGIYSINDAGLMLCATGDLTADNPSRKRILLPVQISSADRLLTGSIPIAFDGIGIEFSTLSGQVLGRYENLSGAMASSSGDGTNYHIYNNKDEIFNSTEGQQIEGNNVDSKRFSSRAVFYKDGNAQLRFMCIFDDIGDIKIRILKDGNTIENIDYTLSPDAKTYAGIVQLARTVAQVNHLPQFNNLEVANDPYSDSEDDEESGNLTGIVPKPRSSLQSAAAVAPLPSKPFDEVPLDIRDRVGNIVTKLIGPMEVTLAMTGGKGWLDQNRQQWNLRMLFLQGYSDGFSMGVEGEVDNAISTVQFAAEIGRLVSSPLAVYYCGRQLYGALVKLEQDISTAGGIKNYCKQMVDNVKEDVESTFDWLNTGYISDENDAYILGHGTGYATETVALFVALNISVNGEAAMAKAVALVREGRQAIQFLNYAGKFKIRMLMWALNYGRYFQVTLGVANNDAALIKREVEEVAKMLNGLAKTPSPYGTSGGSLGVMAQRYQRIDELAKELAKTNRKANGYGDWLTSKHALSELSALSQGMGTQIADALDVPAMRGYARFAQSACIPDTAAGTVHVEAVRSVARFLANEPDRTKLPGVGSINRIAANNLFAMFDEGRNFVLEADGVTWTYKGTLRYGPTGKLNDEQHRIAHMLHHMIDYPGRTVPHGVFTVPAEQVFDLLHEVRTLGIRVPAGGKDFEYTFGVIVGRANNSLQTADGLPLIPYQQTGKVRLGLKANGYDVLTAFTKN